MTFLYPLRYFIVSLVVPPVFIAGFGVAVAAAAARLTTAPAAAVEALTPVVLLQLFVASSGFHIPARRGHFDLLLTSRTPRWQIGLAHCLVSITPGIVAWLCVGMLELAASHGAYSKSLATGTCAAVIGSSLMAWGTAVYSSRVACAIGWLLVMTIPPVARWVSPLHLLGATASESASFAILTAAAAATIPFAAGLVGIVRAATPLEASQ
jgi:hypothetical protein